MATQRDWNIFARELEEVLAARQQSLREIGPQPGLTAGKARRLWQSLQTPGRLPVLTPEDLEDLELELSLRPQEWTRLQAALLATAIERLLIYRIGPQPALKAAEQLMPLLDAVLQERWEQEERLGADRSPDWEAIEGTEEDLTWEVIWGRLDAATLALQLGCSVSSYRERVRALKEAREVFLEALGLLDDLGASIKALPIWEEAYQEARRGLDSALERLDNLGVA